MATTAMVRAATPGGSRPSVLLLSSRAFMTFVPHTRTLFASGASPSRAMLFLHGVLGTGSNWSAIARKLVDSDPSWLAVLVDQRLHGRSRDAPAPHTISAAAEDLARIALDIPVRGVLGHSLGGKIALAFAERRDLDKVVIVDSVPSARPDKRGSESVMQVLVALRQSARAVRFTSRDAFVSAMKEQGIGEGIARWLGMNLTRLASGEMEWTLDLDAIDELLKDYFARDLWGAVRECSVPPMFILGGRSSIFDERDKEMLSLLTMSGLASEHVIEEAGHWVHVDAPDELATLVADD